jgi:hypothetical protein
MRPVPYSLNLTGTCARRSGRLLSVSMVMICKTLKKAFSFLAVACAEFALMVPPLLWRIVFYPLSLCLCLIPPLLPTGIVALSSMAVSRIVALNTYAKRRMPVKKAVASAAIVCSLAACLCLRVLSFCLLFVFVVVCGLPLWLTVPPPANRERCRRVKRFCRLL